jgi:hypothetical protein
MGWYESDKSYASDKKIVIDNKFSPK